MTCSVSNRRKPLKFGPALTTAAKAGEFNPSAS